MNKDAVRNYAIWAYAYNPYQDPGMKWFAKHHTIEIKPMVDETNW